MTTYTSSIPQPTDDPSQSQDQILQNFQSLNTSNSVNHVDFNDADQGKHKFMQMPEQSAAPGTAADEGALYTKAVSGITQLFFQEESSGTERQLTTIAPTQSGSKYYMRLPSGIKLNWGQATGSVAGTTISFTTAFTTIHALILTSQANAATRNAVYDNLTNSNFKLYTTNNSMVVSFIAIGV